jgi:hypothetical protein
MVCLRNVSVDTLHKGDTEDNINNNNTKCIKTDNIVGFNKPDTVLFDRENTTAIVIDIAVPLTHNRPNTEAEKITKYDNLALEIKNVWKLNNVSVHPLVISAEGLVTRSFLKYVKN